MGALSFTHILLIVIVILIFFGPTKIPDLGKSIGKAIRGFKEGLNEIEGEARELPDQNKEQLQAYRQSESQKNNMNKTTEKKNT